MIRRNKACVCSGNETRNLRRIYMMSRGHKAPLVGPHPFHVLCRSLLKDQRSPPPQSAPRTEGGESKGRSKGAKEETRRRKEEIGKERNKEVINKNKITEGNKKKEKNKN